MQEQINQYITQLYAQEDAVLRAIQQSTIDNEMPQISLRPFEGRLLQILMQISGTRRVVEIGTLAGYSGTWIARGLPADGKLITLEVSHKHAAVAQTNFENAGIADKVEIRQGDANTLLEELSADGPYDMVFIDADKKSYPAYLRWSIDNVRSGGLITAHNPLRHGRILNPVEEGDREMAAFNQHIADDARLSSFIIGVGDGMAVALKL